MRTTVPSTPTTTTNKKTKSGARTTRPALIQAATFGARITARACRARGMDIEATRKYVITRLDGQFDGRSFDREPLVEAIGRAIDTVWAEPLPAR
jgi:hypothetical protein